MALSVLVFASCGEDQTQTLGHKLTPEQQEKLVSDIAEDLEVVSLSTVETRADLSRALTGEALVNTNKIIDEDLAKGRVRSRDYRNIDVKGVEYNQPIAEVSAEFDDFGFYKDAKTGAQLTEPTGQHFKYSIAALEEDGRWKIRGIFEPSNPSTPRELPAMTTTTPATPGP